MLDARESYPGNGSQEGDAPLIASEESKQRNDRRQQSDRRGTGRQGKYDRRRNRCGSCIEFDKQQEFCKFHQKPILATDFACPHFQAV